MTTECSQLAMRNTGEIKPQKIDACIRNSIMGSNITISDNRLLREEMDVWRESGLPYFPAIQINNQTYRGDIEADAVLIAVCAGFNKPPDVCEKYMPDGTYDDDSEGHLTTWLIIVIVLVVIILVVALLILYRVWMRRELFGSVKS